MKKTRKKKSPGAAEPRSKERAGRNTGNKPAANTGVSVRKEPLRKGRGVRKASLLERTREMARNAIQFVREVKVELSKVTWPTRKETITSTSVVLVIVILIAAFLGIVDLGLSRIIRLVLS